jgi:hypothetical protein
MNRHALVMICSTFHEIQHIATDMLLNPVADLACEVDERTSPTPGPAKVAKVEKRTTPAHIGSTKYTGRVIGDSGFALEEKIFGGRLMHLEKRSLPTFLVIFEFMIFLRNTICHGEFEFVQMVGVIAEKRSIVEQVEKVERVRLNDSYVLRQLTLLEEGAHPHFFGPIGTFIVYVYCLRQS